ncbi:AraC family transcriptional regulator [Ornithinimicrobium sp. Arc0846-15]|nr:AraC family transcriptional regulator [Ornithinimicrobium laminariae]
MPDAPQNGRSPLLSPLGQAPRVEIIPSHPEHSFRALTHDFPSEICGWGAHPEYEVHLITKTRGTFIAGDHIGTFAPGHVSLMGPNLPHDWVSDLEPGVVAVNRDSVIQFTDEWIRSSMKLMPELSGLDSVLRQSTRGLVLGGSAAAQAFGAIQAVMQTTGTTQLARFFDVLSIFAAAEEHERTVVASAWIGLPSGLNETSAADAGLDYIFKNLTSKIRLAEAAQLAYMSEPAFSKYFKKATGLTFSDMVKKMRVAHARRLLATTDRSISAVASDSGYNNMANFNRQFRAEVGVTPSGYRQLDLADRTATQPLSMNVRAPGVEESS